MDVPLEFTQDESGSASFGISPSQSNAVPVQSVMPGGRADASASQKILTESGKTPLKEAVSPLAKTVRLRDKEHRKFVSQQGPGRHGH
jgi:hypothetical protein